MTIDVQAFSGKPLAAVIDELCMAVTPRWRDFDADIKFTKNREIECHDPKVLRFGAIDIFAEPTEAEIQKRADAVAFAERLDELIACLGNGDLSVEAIRIGADAGAPQIIHAAHFRRNWRMQLYDGEATLILLDAAGNDVAEFALETLKVPPTIGQAIAAARVGADLTENKSLAKSTRKARGKAKNDEAYLAMMEKLILVGKANSLWAAAREIVEAGKVLGVAEPESKIKRLVKGYGESGRPKSVDARNSNSVTQK